MLKVIKRSLFGLDETEISVSSAVKSSLQPIGYGDDADRAAAFADNCADYLTKLTEILAGKGLLSAEELGSLLSYPFKVTESDT